MGGVESLRIFGHFSNDELIVKPTQNRVGLFILNGGQNEKSNHNFNGNTYCYFRA